MSRASVTFPNLSSNRNQMFTDVSILANLVKCQHLILSIFFSDLTVIAYSTTDRTIHNKYNHDVLLLCLITVNCTIMKDHSI